jgi:hypothetical protein
LTEFVLPELEDGDVGTIIESFFAEIFVGEEAGDIEEGGFGAIEEGENSVAEDVFEARTPRVAEHTFQNADNFGTDIGFSRRIGDLERVEGNWVGGVGRVEVDDIFDAAFGDETEVVDGEVAMRVDDTIALVVENIRECEKFEHTGLTSTGLTDDIDVAGAVAAEHAELVVDAAEVS